MGRLRRLTGVCFLCWFCSWTVTRISAQSSGRMADWLLRECAFKALPSNPKTGDIYEGNVPANLTGIKVSALRLRSSSLRMKGAAYKEFHIPAGVYESPHLRRLVLVYQNFGNWSSYFYELDGYEHLTPVLGLLAYDASNSPYVPELDMRATENPILVKFSDQRPAPEGSVRLCVWFGLHGVVSFSKMTMGNTCLAYEQGHFSIVVESIAPAVQPGPSPEDQNLRQYVIVGSVIGCLALVMLLSLATVCALRCEQQKKMRLMEKAAEASESLKTTYVGTAKVPAASHTRTQPTLESEPVS